MPPEISADRKPAFRQRAAALGLLPEQIQQLWAIGGGGHGDGFAPIEQRTGALFSAARITSSIYVHVSVDGLGKLNSAMGHSQADAQLTQARAKMRERLAGLGTLTPLRDRAGGFGFVVMGSTVSPGTILQKATAAAQEIGGKLGIKLIADVQTTDEAAARAVMGDLRNGDSIASAREPAKVDWPRPTFSSSGKDRRDAFLALAQRFGVDSDSAAGLYGVLLESRPDGLTGFENAADRESTTRKAAARVAKSGGAALYVEIDVRNMGGLNAQLGRQKADQVFAQIAGIVEREMMGGSLSSVADAWPFRHGGDEFSFVVVGRRPGIGLPQLEFATVASLTRATAEVKERMKEHAWVPHKKDDKKDPFGTGIVWGIAAIQPGMEPETVFKMADLKVEQKKQRKAVALGK